MSDDNKAALLALLQAAGCTEEVAKMAIEVASKDGLTDMEGAALLTDVEWTGYGVPKITAKKIVKAIADQAKAEAAKVAAASAPAASTGMNSMSLLLQVPNDGDFLKSLQVGGIAKMQSQDVVAALRALFASRYGLYDIDESILEQIAQRAVSLDEPYPDVYYTLQSSMSRKAHSEVLAAIGVPGKIMTERNKKEFLANASTLVSALQGFNEVLEGWYDNWMATVNNPAMIVALFASSGGGGAGTPTIPGMMEAPDTAIVLDAASGFIDKLNKVFRGPGIPVARALGADALQFQELLDKSELIVATGSATREEMLKKIGAAVTMDVIRMQSSLIQFAINVMKLNDVQQGDLAAFCAHLKMLGSNIPWAKLQGESGRPGRTDTATGRAKPF